MNKTGILIFFLLCVTAGCAAHRAEPPVTEFSTRHATVPIPVLRIVYSANTNGQFQPEAG